MHIMISGKKKKVSDDQSATINSTWVYSPKHGACISDDSSTKSTHTQHVRNHDHQQSAHKPACHVR